MYRVLEVKYTFRQAEQTYPKNTNAIIVFHASCAAMIDVTSVYASETLKPLPNLILDLSKTIMVSKESSHTLLGRKCIEATDSTLAHRLTFVIIILRYSDLRQRYESDREGFNNAERTMLF